MRRYIDPNLGVPTLAQALEEHTTSEGLRALVAQFARKVPVRKSDLVTSLLEHLEGEGLRKVWESLSALQKSAVSEVVHSDRPAFRAGPFEAKYGRLPDFGSDSGSLRERATSPLRLLFYGYTLDGAVLPDDLKARLAAFVPPPEKARLESVAELPQTLGCPIDRRPPGTETEAQDGEPVPLSVRQTEHAAPRELLAILRLVDAGKLQVGDKTRRPSAASLAAVGGLLEGGDYYPYQPPKDRWHDENAGPIRAFAWPMLIQAGGLAHLRGSKLELTPAGRKALSAPPVQTLSTLWSKWCASTLVDELSRVEQVKGQNGKGKRGLTALPSRRKTVADALRQCRRHGWVLVDELARFMHASGAPLSVTRNAWGLYLLDPQYGSFGYGAGESLLDLRFLLCLLFEYAATLGIVDVAFVPPAGARSDYYGMWGSDDLCFLSRYDGLAFVRLNALGAFVLGADNAYVPLSGEPRPRLRLHECLEITAQDEAVAPDDRLALDTYAVPTSGSSWKLDSAKLLAASESGRSAAEIRQFLLDRTGMPLPATAARLLDEVSERASLIVDRGPSLLIECADADLAERVASDPKTRKHCLRAGERHLVVPAASESAFRRALREVGYLIAAGKTPSGS